MVKGILKLLSHHLRIFFVDVHKFYNHVDGGSQYVVLTSHHFSKELLGGFPLFRGHKEFCGYGNMVCLLFGL